MLKLPETVTRILQFNFFSFFYNLLSVVIIKDIPIQNKTTKMQVFGADLKRGDDKRAHHTPQKKGKLDLQKYPIKK